MPELTTLSLESKALCVLALEFGLGAVCPHAMLPEKHGFWEQMQKLLQVVLTALCHIDAAAHSPV